jgi:hypothetical protein
VQKSELRDPNWDRERAMARGYSSAGWPAERTVFGTHEDAESTAMINAWLKKTIGAVTD